MRVRRHQHADPVVQSIADDLGDLLEALAGGLVDGVIVEELDFTGSATLTIAHKLGRRPVGFFVVRAIAADPGLFATEANWMARNDDLVTLSATTTATADVMFF